VEIKKNLFGIPTVILVIAILAFLADISHSIASVTVPLLTVDLGASYEFVGTMVALSSLTSLLLVQPIGYLSDRIDKRIFMGLGFLLFLSYFVVLILATSPVHVLVGRILFGAGGAMFYTSAVSFILVNTEKNRGLAMGVYGTLMGLGFSIGPIIGGFVAEKISYDTSYSVSVVFAIIAIIILVLGVKDQKKTSIVQNSETSSKISYFSLFKNKELLIACLGAFFISEAIGADLTFFPVFGNNLNLAEGTIGMILGIRAILSTVVRIPVGKLVDKFGSRILMVAALGSSAIGIFLVPQFRIVWLFPLFLGLEGIGFGTFLTSANSFIGEVTSEENRGAAVGFYNTVSRVGSVLNMTILGFIAGNFGVPYTFRFTGVMCFIGFIINLFFLRNRNTIKKS
jgi:MFS family permease